MIDRVHHAAQGVLLARDAEIALQGVCLLVVVAQTQRRHALQRHLGHADLDVLAAHVLDLRVEVVVVVQVGGALLGRAAHAARVGQGLARRGRIAGQAVFRYRGQRQPLESDGCSPHVLHRTFGRRERPPALPLLHFLVSARFRAGPIPTLRSLWRQAARVRQQKGRTRFPSFIVVRTCGPLGAARAVPVMGLVSARLCQRVPALWPLAVAWAVSGPGRDVPLVYPRIYRCPRFPTGHLIS